MLQEADSGMVRPERRLRAPLRDSLREAFARRHYPLGYTPALDGLRGLMTLCVFVAHVSFSLAPGAIRFMDVFFVMSGYFITSLLLRDLERHGRIRYGEFYRRRFARILPAFVLMLLAYVAFRCAFAPPFEEAMSDVAIAFTYIANWWRAFELPGITYMGHTWSLAVEEQFYLLWPVSFALLVRRFGVSWRLAGAIMAAALAIWVWRIWLTAGGAPYMRLYNGLDTRADALMVGCALAVVLKLTPPAAHPRLDRLLRKLAWPLSISLVALTFVFVPYTDPSYYLAGIMICGALPGALLVALLTRSGGTVAHRMLEWPAALFLGKIFYGVYLWHWPILYFIKYELHASVLFQIVVGLPATLLMATLSYACLERHFIRVRGPAQGRNSVVQAAVESTPAQISGL